jgi:DNA-binding transcriptional MerR regulator
VPQLVVRFWESRFSQIRPMKRGGGRRYYRPDDVDLLRGIRHLLYGQGYTIRGVQRILREQGPRFVQAVWQEGAPQPPVGRGEAAAGERGVFGLWPAMGAKEELDGEDADVGTDEVEAPDADAPPHVRLAAAQPAPAGLPSEHIKRLREMLDRLIACRELLDSVLGDPI